MGIFRNADEITSSTSLFLVHLPRCGSSCIASAPVTETVKTSKNTAHNMGGLFITSHLTRKMREKVKKTAYFFTK